MSSPRRRLLIAATLIVLAGVGAYGASATVTPPQPSAAACVSAVPEVAAVAVAFVNGRAEPAPRRVPVERGSTVQLAVSTDTDIEVHVHGYDVAGRFQAGQLSCIRFFADRVGLFDVEAHPDTLLLQLEVR